MSKIESVAFTIYKPILPQGKPDVVGAGLPWVYDQDPSSGYAASMRVVPESAMRQAIAEATAAKDAEIQEWKDKYNGVIGNGVA